MKLFFFILITLQFIDVNKAIAQPTKDSSKSCVVILPPDLVKQYEANYYRDYHKLFNKKRTLKIEFPKDYFVLIGKFLEENNQEYDGAKFVFGSFNDRVNKRDQSHKKQIIVMVGVTKDTIVQWNDLTTYNDAKKIISSETPSPKLYNKMNQIKNKSNLPHNRFILLNSNTACKYSQNYQRKYKDSTRYSFSLFLCKQNFLLLAELMNDELGKDIDGVILSFAHYDQILEQTKQIGPKQISLILTPSIKGKPQYDLVDKYAGKSPKYQYLLDISNKSKLSVNHGELCPNSCK